MPLRYGFPPGRREARDFIDWRRRALGLPQAEQLDDDCCDQGHAHQALEMRYPPSSVPPPRVRTEG